jgi:hypothetical protein
MNWLVVVLFATMMGDIYILTDPSFETREECMTFVVDDREKILTKLYMEYGQALPIRAVNCLQEDNIRQILTQIESET